MALKQYLSGMALFVALASSHANTILVGLISRDRPMGPPVGGVAISALGANPTVSATDGQFRLVFPTKYPGQDIRIIVNRPGMSVVNDFVLETRLPAPGARPIEIIVTEDKHWQSRRSELLRLAGSQIVNKRVIEELAGLSPAARASTPDVERVEKQRTEALQQVTSITNTIGPKPASDFSVDHQSAIAAYLTGDTKRALELLDGPKLSAQSREADTARIKVMNSWLFRAQLLSLEFKWDEAGEAYDSALRLGDRSFLVWYQYASFNFGQNHFEKARRGYNKALELAKIAGSQSGTAIALHSLARVEAQQNNPVEALRAFSLSLDAYRKLAEADSAYLPMLAGLLNDISKYYSDLGDRRIARRYAEESVVIYRRLSEAEMQYTNLLALALNNLAIINVEDGKISEARAGFSESLKIRKIRRESLPQAGAADYAESLINIGNFERSYGNLTRAVSYIKEGVIIVRDLVSQNPRKYRPLLAVSLANLGAIQINFGALKDARSSLEEALLIDRALAQEGSFSAQQHLGVVLDRIGRVNLSEGRYTEARAQLNESLSIYQATPALYANAAADVVRTLRQIPD